MQNVLLPLLEINLPIDGVGARILYGAQMLLIGMLIVFAVLALLWILLELSGVLFAKLSLAERQPTEKKAEPTVPVEVARTDDGELVAVLTAAIAAMESAPAARFRVVSFKRK